MIRNQEALQERVEEMHFVPREVQEAVVSAMDAGCSAFMETHYTLSGETFRLNTAPHAVPTADRLRILECLDRLNGIEMALVDIVGDEATLQVHFYNGNGIDDLAAAAPLADTFRLRGGRRLVAGRNLGDVQVTSASRPDPEAPVLELVVRPIGDYSTYTLSLDPLEHAWLDPFVSEIDFKFRPGCFTNCAPTAQAQAPSGPTPAINYLAKDFDTFRHTLIAWMMQRVPGWQPTSQADLDMVLIELMSAAADELSDFQDRVMNEAYLGTARKRVSLARHARLMDYHLYQGNQASTWLVVETGTEHALSEDLTVWAGHEEMDSEAVVFSSRSRLGDGTHTFRPITLFREVNRLSLYTWSHAAPSLAAGSTQADLAADGEAQALRVAELVNSGDVSRLLVQEHLNPATGHEAGRRPTMRQLLRLTAGSAFARHDPVAGAWYVQVKWDEQDALRQNYCFEVRCDRGWIEGVSLFHGNLIEVHHGRVVRAIFREPGASGEVERHYLHDRRRTVIAQLPEGPLLYSATPARGEVPPVSTLEVEVEAGGLREVWRERPWLLHSDARSGGRDFVVETDEVGRSRLRFGDGINGRRLPAGAVVHARYQAGRGPEGNVGADTLIHFDRAAFTEIAAVWNPFDVTGGRSPESREDVIRRAPEAYRVRQLRAVTLQDYINRAEELEGVSRASARYMWTGSWRSVRVTIDPKGTTSLAPEVRGELARYLDAVGLLGEDVEIRAPRFVPLDIRVHLCVHPDFWPEDVAFLLEESFSDGYTRDGRRGFFHPDLWTFGQELHQSQILGRIHEIQGVDQVISVSITRRNDPTPGTSDVVSVRPEEIILVRNDPDRQEDGHIAFELRGGRT